MAWTQRRLKTALGKHEAWLMQQPGVNSAGIGLDEAGAPCLVVSSDALPEAVRRQIETTLQDVPVRFENAGPFHALKRGKR